MTPNGLTRLKMDEASGVARLKVYSDATGQPLSRLPDGGWATIGWGRNLTGKGLSKAEADLLLANDIAEIEGRWSRVLAGIASPVCRDVVVMVDYNTGNVGGFPHMLAAMTRGDVESAALELLDSRAARELPERYNRMADAIRHGVWEV